MMQNNFEDLSNQSEAELLLAESRRSLEQLRNGIVGTFEYKNRSRDGNYYVFAYNTVAGETVANIKQKYISQYGGKIDGLLVTDAKGKTLDNQIFNGGEKVYLKVKMSNHPNPVQFFDLNGAGWNKKYRCNIKIHGRNVKAIKQIYQDEFDVVIENSRFIITDKEGNRYDNDAYTFQPGDIVYITVKEKSDSSNDLDDSNHDGSENDKNGNYIERNEKKEKKNKFKEMIDNQVAPLTHGNRSNPEISLTFDDGYGRKNIEHILDTLEGSGIKATFFILGDCLKNYPDLWKRAIDEGHQICCHTYSHIYLDDKSNITDLKSSLNKDLNIQGWIKNVTTLLGIEYYENLKSENGKDFPNLIKSDLLLETEILMREEQIKMTLGEEYLQKFKIDHPFFRFPGGHGAKRQENIAVLKKLGYLSIGWSEDFFRGSGKNRKHMETDTMENMEVKNGDIPLFHFKESDYKYIDAYIKNLKSKRKSYEPVSEIL